MWPVVLLILSKQRDFYTVRPQAPTNAVCALPNFTKQILHTMKHITVSHGLHSFSLRAQTVLCGVVAPCYQYHQGATTPCNTV